VKLILLTAASAALFASALVIAPISAAGEKRTTVRVMDNFFDARSATIAPGANVTFVWKGTNRHNVRFTKVPAGTSKKGSKARRTGEWSRRFWKPGVYRYVCTLFDGMRGTITVKKPPPPQTY
jgi:plastocyanin